MARQYGTLSLERLHIPNNIITVKLLEAVGVPDYIAFANRLGLPLRAAMTRPRPWHK
jgi:hypothetical protein